MSRYQSPSSRFNDSAGLRPSEASGRQGYNEPTYQQPRGHRDEEPLVRCSTCGQELAMHALADHVCERSIERRRPSEGLRVDVKAAGSRVAAYGANLSARSPMYPGELVTCSSGGRPSSATANLYLARLLQGTSTLHHRTRPTRDPHPPLATPATRSCRDPPRASPPLPPTAASFPSSRSTRTWSEATGSLA